jgi:hypothetical protein
MPAIDAARSPASQENMAELLTFEDIACYPRPGMSIPRQLEFTPRPQERRLS